MYFFVVVIIFQCSFCLNWKYFYGNPLYNEYRSNKITVKFKTLFHLQVRTRRLQGQKQL